MRIPRATFGPSRTVSDPDGRTWTVRVVHNRLPQPGEEPDEQRADLVEFPLDGSRSPRLTELPGQAAAVSPDGSMVAFATGNGDESNSHGISTMRIDGSDIRAVTHGNDGVPAWSADGRSLYFARLKTDSYGAYCGSIFSVAASGGNLHRITHASKTGHDHEDPAVSPDGTRIAFSDWDACEGGTSSPDSGS